MKVSTIGLDIAKNVFQVHGVDEAGALVVARRLRRGQVLAFFAELAPCLVGLEACATAHYWARELRRLGHEVRLLPPVYVKAYVKRNKHDAADAAAICEAVGRPTMRFVSPKGEEEQSVLMLHKTRALLVRQRTMLANALRAHLAEFGFVARQGREGLSKLLALAEAEESEELAALARPGLRVLAAQWRALDLEIRGLERALKAWHLGNERSRRLAEIPGVGPLTASALVASVGDAGVFSCGRDLAAWIGLVPRESSSGGKRRLGPISKQGNRYLRWLLVSGAMAVLRQGKRRGFRNRPWLARLAAERPAKLAAVALANRTARIAWVLMARGERYRAPAPQAA